ncbi:alginate export family protein [Lewinella sp. JB7]|uniref:alginate export family protein n=1 Tax=Lewinella sp. JB7 TaxID=2962887 RepID=UPI0020C9BC4E|nr:alginate export family protein [Lewinella sp. JB7]MCP9236572.1 alginate export family protein [Lewinella sp. JB7]
MRLIASALLLSLLSSPLSGQFKLSAEVRPRTEFRNGFKTPRSAGSDPAFFTEQRSRVYVDYAEEKYTFRLALQDVRLWGEVPQIFKNENGNTFLSEAWGQYAVNPRFSVRAGRQIISYDNERILGGLEWAQQGRRHDALLLQFENKKKIDRLHVGLAYNSDDDVPEPAYLQAPAANYYSVSGNYKSLQYAWYNHAFTEDKGSVSLLALNATLQNADSTVSHKQTLGTYVSYRAGKLTFIGDLYAQTGRQNGRPVGALLAGLSATYPTKVTPITLGAEFISGQDATTESNRITAFQPDYGTNHAFNGLMDYFYVGPANGTVGVTDLYLKTKWKLGGAALLAHGHQFFTGSAQVDADGERLPSAMGTEVDLVYVRPLAAGVTLHVGYSHLLGTENADPPPPRQPAVQQLGLDHDHLPPHPLRERRQAEEITTGHHLPHTDLPKTRQP